MWDILYVKIYYFTMPRIQKTDQEKKKADAPQPPTEPSRFSTGETALLLAQLLLSGLSWFTIKFSLNNWSTIIVIATVGSFCLSLAVLVLNSILNRQRQKLLLTWLLSLLWIPIWFGISVSVILSMIVAALAGLFLISHMGAQSRKMSKQDFWLMTKSGLEFALVLLVLAISLAYFGHLQISARQGPSTLQRIQVSGTLFVEQILLWKIPSYNSNMTLDAVVGELAKEGSEQIANQVTNSSTPPISNNSNESIGFQDLPPEQQEQIIATQQQASEEALTAELMKQRDELLQKYNIQADGGSSVGSVINQLVINFLSRFLGPFTSWLDHLLVFGLFVTLLATTPVYRFIIRISTLLLAKIFVALKIISVHKEKREVEVMELN